jgi:hypothetical protein
MASTINGSTCPERLLLACCARRRIPPAIVEKTRSLVESPLDWDYLLTAARDNSVTPLLERQLSAVATESVPVHEMARLRAAARMNVVRCLALAGELYKVVGAFGSRGIAAISYKGPVLGAQAYGDMTLREFEDLDIILPQRQMPLAHEAMTVLGYRPKCPDLISPSDLRSFIPGEYAYRDPTGRVVVELHTERTLRHIPVTPEVEVLAARAVIVSIDGHEIRTFAPEDGLPILSIHGSKDFWERIGWVADIAELVQSQGGLDWDAIWRQAEVLRAQRMVSLGLLLATELLDAPLPQGVASRVHKDRVTARIAAELRQRLLSRAVPHRTASERFRFRRRMLPGAPAGWGYALRLAFAPAEQDWGPGGLPRRFGPLYALLRPFRLWRKYGAHSGAPGNPRLE